MMLVKTRNKNPKISREELRFASRFMYSLLVTERQHNKTVLTIVSKLVEHEWGLEGETETVDGGKSPKEFRILINSKYGKRKQLIALAHELVHMKQFARNELAQHYITYNNENWTKWKRRYINESKKSYWVWPWEIQANGMQEGLYRRYMNFVKKHKIKFKPD